MLMSPQNLPERIEAVQERVARAAAGAGRVAQSVTLLAVGKAQPPELLAAAAACGLKHFGESYLQEALAKIAALGARELTWHFAGWPALAALSIAERLAAQRPFHAPPLNVCLQVNLAQEHSKGGVTPAELPALAAAVAGLPRLALRGLMCVPPEESEPARQRAWFARLRELLERLNATGARLDTLSMGVSGDFAPALAEGSTIVRLGTA